MTTESNHCRRLNETPTLSHKLPGTRSGSTSTPTNSSKALSGGHATRKPTYVPTSSGIRCTRRSSKRDAHLRDRRALASRRTTRQQPTRSSKITRRSPDVSEDKEGKGRFKSSDTSRSSLDLHTVSPSSRASENLENVEENGETCQAEPPIQSLGETEIDEADLRHRALRKLEEQERKKASDKYQQTGDMSVFAPFMAPFVAGPDRPKLGSWIWDCSVKRWRREHTLDGRIVWGPTDDCFI
ncbi:hypothetical protein V8F33_004488 [Rhypophila sp. PSN 637]